MNRRFLIDGFTEGFISVMIDNSTSWVKDNLPKVLISVFATLFSIGIITAFTMNSTQKVHHEDIGDNAATIDKIIESNTATANMLGEIVIQQRLNTNNIGLVVISQRDLTKQLNELTNQITALTTKSESDDRYQRIIIDSAIQNIKDNIYELKSSEEEFNAKVLEKIQEIEKRLYILEIEIRKLQKVVMLQEEIHKNEIATTPVLKSLNAGKKNIIQLNDDDVTD